MPTLKASTQGIARIKQARKEKGWTVYDPQWLEAASQVLGVSWEDSGFLAEGISEGTWKRFLAGKQAINCEAFKAYCQVLELDWQEVVERSAIATPIETSTNRQDWGEAMDVSQFYGRAEELQILQRWLSRTPENNCRFIVLLGMGGIGKTAISIKVAQQLQTEFEYIIWRSLRNAPTVEELLADLIQFLSQQQETHLPETLDGKISRLLQYLRSSRCLLILDNAESILKSGDRAGNYKEGYQGYGQLIRSLSETQHQSCTILTSREKPKGIAAREGENLPVRCLHLSGLPETEGREIFQAKGSFLGTETEWQMLIDRYAGNPLALKIVASAIRDFFNGSLASFLDVLKQGSFLFDDIRDLLSQQFNRLTNLEKQIMYWLAIDREPVTFRELQADFFQKASINEVIQSLAALQQRSLVEKSSEYFTQQPVVMEYVTQEFIDRVCEEIASEEISLLQNYAWIKATAKDYIREAQISLILQPAIEQLLVTLSSQKNIEYTLKQILEKLRSRSRSETGYVAGNILNLLRQLKADATGWDFSHLAVWQAYLQGMNLHDVNFSHADLSRSVFTETLGNILCVAFSPDGTILATGDTDCRIRLWDVQTGQLLAICNGHTHWVRSVAFSPDGRLLASGSADRTVRLWDAKTHECIRIYTDHDNEVYTVSFNPQGNLLASGSGDNTIRIWNVLGGNCSKILTGHTHWIRSVVFSPILSNFSDRGGILASGSADTTIRLWDVETGECLQTLTGHTNWVRSIAFTPDGKTLMSCSSDKTIKYWEVETGNCDRADTGHDGGIYSIALSPDGRILASGSGDKTIRFWDIETGEILKIFHGKIDQVLAIAFSNDNSTLACVSQNQIVTLWNWQIDRCFRTLHGHTDWAFPVAFHPDGNLLASGSSDRTVKVWDVASEKLLHSLQGHTDQIMSVAFSNDRKIMASSSADRTVRLWDIQTGLCLLVLQGHIDWVDSVSFSPNARILASGSGDATIRLWDVETGQCLNVLTEHTDQVYSVAYRRKSGREPPTLVSGSADRTAKIWNAETGEYLKTFSGHQSRIYAVAFNYEGNLLATASADSTVKIWDVESGECLQTLSEHDNWVYSVTFVGNGNILASASADRIVRLWDVRTGECLHVCTGHTHQLCAVAASPDGSMLASGSQDQMVRIWDIQTGECLKTLIAPRLYEGMKIAGTKGLTPAQVMTLEALGAIENEC
jgi:WD40 repeat protein/transcriptional regulator with XRE-family HTH domain